MSIKKKYQKQFQREVFEQLDSLFPDKNKERDNALLLVSIIIVKFQKILERINEDIKNKQ